MKKFALFTILLFSPHISTAAEILTTIKPVYSLVSSIAEGSGKQVDLLVKGQNSPHGYQLKPSQLEQLNNAEVIFYVDRTYEFFLNSAFANLSEDTRKIALSETRGVGLLPIRSGGLWEKHSHGHDESKTSYHVEGLKTEDMHFFLSPQIARLLAHKITDTLSRMYPEKKEIFAVNYEKLVLKLDTYDARLRRELAPVKDTPFIVFHDAMQYFDKDYGLNDIGSITLEPDQPLQPKRLQKIQDKISNNNVVCVFSEPQFSDKMVNKLVEGTDVRTATLDPEAIELKPSTTLYFEMLEKMKNSLVSCLGER